MQFTVTHQIGPKSCALLYVFSSFLAVRIKTSPEMQIKVLCCILAILICALAAECNEIGKDDAESVLNISRNCEPANGCNPNRLFWIVYSNYRDRILRLREAFLLSQGITLTPGTTLASTTSILASTSTTTEKATTSTTALTTTAVLPTTQLTTTTIKKVPILGQSTILLTRQFKKV